MPPIPTFESLRLAITKAWPPAWGAATYDSSIRPGTSIITQVSVLGGAEWSLTRCCHDWFERFRRSRRVEQCFCAARLASFGQLSLLQSILYLVPFSRRLCPCWGTPESAEGGARLGALPSMVQCRWCCHFRYDCHRYSSGSGPDAVLTDAQTWSSPIQMCGLDSVITDMRTSLI
jgi:hypothetical protein